MLALVAADAAVFDGFMKAYKLPKTTDEEKAFRINSIQIAAYDASGGTYEDSRFLSGYFASILYACENRQPQRNY